MALADRLALKIAVAVAAALCAPAAAAATVTLSDAGSTRTIQVTDLQAAQLLINNGKPDDAKKILTALLAKNSDDSEALFLLGLIAVGEKDFDTAIDDFRRILVTQPDAERVRLELGRTFYMKGDYDNARIQFQRARAGDVPDAVKTNIDKFLIAMTRNKEWSFNFSLALAPDTNENAATSINQVNIYGLPFTLDSSARRKSGIGLFADAGGEYSPLLNDFMKARIGFDAYRTEYGGGRFDDMTVSSYAGPQFLFSDWDLSVLGTGFQRWYGNKPYVNGAGGRVAADLGIASDWQIGAAAGAQNISYHNIPAQSGPLFSFQASVNHTLSPSNAVQFQAGYNRQNTALPAYSYDGWWIGLGYQQDLPFGFSANLQPSYFITKYDTVLAGFGVARHDQVEMVRASFLNRRFSYRGFTPQFSYTFTIQRSNVALYSYTRSQFQIGITSQF